MIREQKSNCGNSEYVYFKNDKLKYIRTIVKETNRQIWWWCRPIIAPPNTSWMFVDDEFEMERRYQVGLKIESRQKKLGRILK